MWSEIRHSYRSCKGPFIIELLVVNRLDRKIKRYYFFSKYHSITVLMSIIPKKE